VFVKSAQNQGEPIQIESKKDERYERQDAPVDRENEVEREEQDASDAP
jgi:hypothetical protein